MSHLIHGAKYLWKLPASSPDHALDVAAQYNISIPIAQTLLSRGFADKKTIDAFLFSSFEQDVAPARLLKDAEKAVDRIIQAINAQKKYLFLAIMTLMALLHLP